LRLHWTHSYLARMHFWSNTTERETMILARMTIISHSNKYRFTKIAVYNDIVVVLAYRILYNASAASMSVSLMRVLYRELLFVLTLEHYSRYSEKLDKLLMFMIMLYDIIIIFSCVLSVHNVIANLIRWLVRPLTNKKNQCDYWKCYLSFKFWFVSYWL